MEKKYLNEFVSLFKYLSDAAGIIEENCNSVDVPPEHRDGYEKLKRLQGEKIEETYSRIIDIRSNTNSGFMADLTNEIEENLYKYPQNQDVYIKSIIRQFSEILPYFDIPSTPQLWDLSFDWEKDNIKIGGRTYGQWINYVFKIQIEYFKVVREKFTIAEHYIISSGDLLRVFYIFVDAKCLDFEIDLMTLQQDLNIYLFRHRDTHHKTWLDDLGYREKLNGILKKSTNTVRIPEELETEEAKKLFQRAIESKFIDSNYRWLGDDKKLLAYFVVRASECLGLSKSTNADGTRRTSWKPFEALLNQEKLSSVRNEYMKFNTKFTPSGYENIDKLFI